MGSQQKNSNVFHFSHSHPLEYTTSSSTGDVTCFGCKLSITYGDDYYQCKTCAFISLHYVCYKMPLITNHLAHLMHDLVLLAIPSSPATKATLNCVACGHHVTGFCYHCAECSIFFHTFCLALPLSIALTHHPHKIQLEFSPPYAFFCDLCNKPSYNKGWLYRCSMCEFDTHIACAIENLEPQSIQHPSFPESNALLKQLTSTQERLNEVAQVSSNLTSGLEFSSVKTLKGEFCRPYGPTRLEGLVSAVAYGTPWETKKQLPGTQVDHEIRLNGSVGDSSIGYEIMRLVAEQIGGGNNNRSIGQGQKEFDEGAVIGWDKRLYSSRKKHNTSKIVELQEIESISPADFSVYLKERTPLRDKLTPLSDKSIPFSNQFSDSYFSIDLAKSYDHRSQVRKEDQITRFVMSERINVSNFGQFEEPFGLVNWPSNNIDSYNETHKNKLNAAAFFKGMRSNDFGDSRQKVVKKNPNQSLAKWTIQDQTITKSASQRLSRSCWRKLLACCLLRSCGRY